MNSYSKATWLLIIFVMTAMLALIGVIEVRIPSSSLSTMLMLGVMLLGYASIFAWLYRHRAPVESPKQTRGFRLVRRVNKRPVYGLRRLQEKA